MTQCSWLLYSNSFPNVPSCSTVAHYSILNIALQQLIPQCSWFLHSISFLNVHGCSFFNVHGCSTVTHLSMLKIDLQLLMRHNLCLNGHGCSTGTYITVQVKPTFRDFSRKIQKKARNALLKYFQP